MIDDHEACYRALAARDPRFDGVLFVGVSSTGIYCRPICPARTPRPDRCQFFETAAEAHAAGFRPCKRCRPENAPGWAPVDAKPQMARAALRAIQKFALQEPSADHSAVLERVATWVGASPRHLRRVVRETYGQSPRDLLHAIRTGFARTLLNQTSLKVGEVALASGYRSERRLRAAYVKHYGYPPSAERRARASIQPAERGREVTPSNTPLHLHLAFRPPLAWRELLRFFEHHSIPGVDAVVDAGTTYRRTVALQPPGLDRLTGVIEATLPDPCTHILRVTVSRSLAPALGEITQRVRRVFDLDARPDLVDDALAKTSLRTSVIETPGLRVAGAFDPFETAARIILGQQVSVRGATTLTERYVEAFGEPCHHAEGFTHTTPAPSTVAAVSPDEVAHVVGLPRTRARSLNAIAELFADHGGDLAHERIDTIRSTVQSLVGVGPWTTELILMRCFGWPDAMPAEDLVLMQQCGASTPKQLREISAQWRPWRSYGATHLWTHRPDRRHEQTA